MALFFIGYPFSSVPYDQTAREAVMVLDSVSSPITRRVYNLGLDEFFAWFGRERDPASTKRP
jgi:hypothetical protein